MGGDRSAAYAARAVESTRNVSILLHLPHFLFLDSLSLIPSFYLSVCLSLLHLQGRGVSVWRWKRQTSVCERNLTARIKWRNETWQITAAIQKKRRRLRRDAGSQCRRKEGERERRRFHCETRKLCTSERGMPCTCTRAD